MGSEERSNLWTVILDIEYRESGLPFIGVHAELGYLYGRVDADVLFLQEPIIEALHNHSCSVAEEAGLVVVAISGMALHLELIPCPCVNLVFLGPKGIELQEDSYRLSRNIPSSDTDGDGNLTPTLSQREGGRIPFGK